MADTLQRSRGAVADQPSETDVEMIVFKHVSLAFDDTVVLRDVSDTLSVIEAVPEMSRWPAFSIHFGMSVFEPLSEE